MFGEKEIDVYEDANSLGMTLKWYTGTAWFLLFFTIIWNAFLAFWYSMAIGVNAPLMFKLFPIIHVGVGVYLFYYTLCLFLNRTYVDVAGDYLTVVHKPIPWWRGNKRFLVNDIEQLYVKEQEIKGKNSTRHVYQLRVKLKNKRDDLVLALEELSSQKMQEIEGHLEKFIGINDYRVKGEYARNQHLTSRKETRRHRHDFSDSNMGAIYNFKVGSPINLRDKELDIISITQYDWVDGNSDKLFQLVDPNNKENLLYLEQNKALLNAYQEKILSILETKNISFQAEIPPLEIEFKGHRYPLSAVKKGREFISGTPESIEITQRVYRTEDGKKYIRVIDNQGLIDFFQGEKLQSTDFEDNLDLNMPPSKELDFKENYWQDEDLV